MKLYIEIKNRIVHKLLKAEDCFPRKKGQIIETEDTKMNGDIYCVIDISNHGKDIEAYCFSTFQEAVRTFKSRAFHKFSNWEDYSTEDIEAVIEQGFEKTGDGSLCLCSL